MTELTRYWQAGRMNKSLLIRRWWWPSLYQLREWWRGKKYSSPVEIRLRTWQHCGLCYCPTGSTTDLRVNILGIGFWASLTRDWTPKPCHCDKIMWVLYPSDYQDEIEEYGADRLRAEYPNVESLEAA